MNGYQDFFKAKRKIAKAKAPERSSPIKNNSGKSDSRWMALVATLLAVGSLWYLTVGETQTAKVINRFEVSVFGAAKAGEAGTENSAATGSKAEEKRSPQGEPDAPTAVTPKRAWTDEEVTLFTKLEDRKKQLDERENNLNKLEEELQKQKDDLEKRLASLEDVRGKIAAKLEDKVKNDGEKVTALVSVYSNMKPAQAAVIIEGLNEDLAVDVLTKMKNKSAAEILNLMNPEKAKRLSEKFAGFKEASNGYGK
jgi:flagellar motility protein MotE (MotC chaperone)